MLSTTDESSTTAASYTENDEGEMNIFIPNEIEPLKSSSVQEVKKRNYITLIEVPCHRVVETSFKIRNETPIASSFAVISTYFSENKKKEVDVTEEVLQDFYGRERDKWCSRIRNRLGLVVVLEPMSGELEEHQTVKIKLLIYADTWGDYTDVILCIIHGLPPFTINLQVQVMGLPIHFPITQQTICKHPTLRFGVLKYRGDPVTKSIVLHNDSCIQLRIIWYLFVTEPFPPEEKMLFKEMIDAYMSVNGDEEDNLTSTMPEEMMKLSALCNPEVPRHISDIKQMSIFDDCYKYFQIDSPETVIEPKKDATLKLTVNPNVPDLRTKHVKLKATLLGIIDITPEDGYCPGQYFRRSNYEMLPVVLNMSADVDVPMLTTEIDSLDVHYYIPAIYVMQDPNKTYTETKVILLKNYTRTWVAANATIDKPFHVSLIKIQSSSQHCSDSHMFTVKPNETVEVHVSCTLNEEQIKMAYDMVEKGFVKNISELVRDDVCEKELTLKRTLTFSQNREITQTLDLEVTIIFSSLKSHPSKLDFESVFLNECKCLFLELQNMSGENQSFQLKLKDEVPEFQIVPASGILLPKSGKSKCAVKIKICFTPLAIDVFSDAVEIHTSTPFHIKEIPVCGKGIYDTKNREQAIA